MRSIRVLRNIVTNYLREFSGGLIGFIITPIMVELLGKGDYGLWVTVFSLTGYFGLVDQGIRPSLVRYVSRHKTEGDEVALSRTISTAVALYAAVGVVVVLATLIVSANFGHWFKIDPSQHETGRVALLLAGASLAMGFPLGVFGATLSGLQRYDVANAFGIGIGIVRALLFVFVLRAGGGIVGLAWCSLATNLLGHSLSYVWARRLLPGVPLGWRFVHREQLRRIGSYSGIAFIGAVAASLSYQTDAVVIAAFLGISYVTPFALASTLIERVRSLVYSATWVLSPTASEMDTLGETEKLQAMLIAGCKYSVLVSWPVLLGLAVFGENFYATWMKHSYTQYATQQPWSAVFSANPVREASPAQILCLLGLPTMLSLPQSTASSVLFGISRHKGVVVLLLLSALCNLGLSILWVRSWGLAGVALGTAVPLVTMSGIATAVMACRVLHLPLGRYLWEGMGRPGFACLAFLVPALAVQKLWYPTGWWALGAAVAGCWLVFAACVWRFGISHEERARWAQAVSGLLRFSPIPATPEAEG